MTDPEEPEQPNDPPTVTIEAPSEGATFEEGETVRFEGRAEDPEEGALSGQALVWESDLDGRLGTGSTVERADLSTGTHTITLTATDGEGASASAEVEITVEPTAAPDVAPDAFIGQTDPRTDRVWLNDGDGTLTDTGQELGNEVTVDLALGDLDDDGDLDAFTAVLSGGFRVWLNDGSGAFSAGAEFSGNGNTHSVALGDLDGDGDLDAFEATGSAPDRVWLNDGSAGFSRGEPLPVELDTCGVALGDLDGDGDLDAFLATCEGPGEVLLNDGSGSFTHAQDAMPDGFGLRENLTDVDLADLDGDGDLDAFVTTFGARNTRNEDRIWLNDGDASFEQGASLRRSSANSVALEDLDGDGDPDAVVTTEIFGTDSSDDPEAEDLVLLNDGTGVFRRTGFGDDSRDVALGDLDGDGDPDALIVNDGPDRIWLNDGSGAFSRSDQALGNAEGGSVAIGDLDGQ